MALFIEINKFKIVFIPDEINIQMLKYWIEIISEDFSAVKIKLEYNMIRKS